MGTHLSRKRAVMTDRANCGHPAHGGVDHDCRPFVTDIVDRAKAALEGVPTQLYSTGGAVWHVVPSLFDPNEPEQEKLADAGADLAPFFAAAPQLMLELVAEVERLRPNHLAHEHHIDMYQARCTKCGYVETSYGDFGAFDDVQDCIDTLEDSWFARYRYEPKPRPDCPNGRIAHVEELLCPSCQKCEVCGAEAAYPADEHLVCEAHEDHDFAAEARP